MDLRQNYLNRAIETVGNLLQEANLLFTKIEQDDLDYLELSNLCFMKMVRKFGNQNIEIT